MESAFELLSRGDFRAGLHKLSTCPDWRDKAETLDGPFYLGFPGKPGWGEGLLIASLLKRYASYSKKQISCYAHEQLRSILREDPAFSVECAQSNKFRSGGARPPLAVVTAALLGNLLDHPFVSIETKLAETAMDGADFGSAPRIGIAWASIGKSGEAIPEKSIRLQDFLCILRVVNHADVVSFQRKPKQSERDELHERFGENIRFLSDNELELNQAVVVNTVQSLSCMVTISTTTAHIAAALGVPVILLAAKRTGQQWFWRAQAEYGRCFYPTVDVVLGTDATHRRDWWEGCIEAAQSALLQHKCLIVGH
jgi:hypothetical protein